MFWGQNLLIASPKGEMKRTFSWTSFYKIHTSGTLCFAQPTLEKLNQAKLLYSIKLSSEIEFFITMHTPLCEPAVHTGTSLSVLKSPSGTSRVSDCHSSLVTTPSSRRILHKSKIEVTKLLIHHVGKNGKPFYGENSIYEYCTKRHIKSNQHMGILHEFINCVRETSNHWLSPSEVDWVDPKENLKSMDPTTHQMYICSWKLTREVNSTAPSIETLWLTGELMKLTQKDTTSLKLTGEAWFHFQPYD